MDFLQPSLKSFFFILTLCFCCQFANAQASNSEFKPSGKVWGYGFTDFYYKASGDTATWASRAEYSGVQEKIYAFAIRRMYLGYDYNISPVFSTQVVLEGSDNYLVTRGDRSVTIKTLYVKWKGFFGRTDLLIGQIPTPTYSMIPEKVWGYRSVEKTISDMRGHRSSSDMGIGLSGVFDTLGNYGYDLVMGNGVSTRPEELTQAGKHKVYYADVYGYFLDRKLVVQLYADYQTGINERNAVLTKGFLGYQSDVFSIGGELMSQTLSNVKSDGENGNPFGFSIFARGTIVKDKLMAFARYDSYDPDNNYRDVDALTTFSLSNMFRHYEENFFLIGLDIAPHKNVHIIPNLWINSYKPKADNNILVEREADIVPRITFYFQYR